MSRYKLLFSIKISHQYYTNGPQRDFDIGPTEQAARLLRRYRCRFRSTPDGGEVYCQVDGNGDPVFDLSQIPNFEHLIFSMKLRNPQFLTYTSFAAARDTAVPIRNRVMYLSPVGVTPATAGGVTAVSLLPGASPAVSDNDGDAGTVPAVTYTGAISDIIDRGLVADTENLIGEDDGAVAAFNPGDAVVVQLAHQVPALESLALNLISPDSDDELTIEGSLSGDPTSFAPLGVLNLTAASSGLAVVAVNIPAGFTEGVRYLRIRNTSPGSVSTSIDVESVTYSFTATPDGSSAYLHHIPTFVELKGTTFRFEQAAASGNRRLQLRTPNGDVAHEASVAVQGGLASFDLELPGLKSGLYQLFMDTDGSGTTYNATTPAQLFIGPEFLQNGFLGAIDIFQTNGDFATAEANDRVLEYHIDFTCTRRVWRYFVVQKTPLPTLPNYAIRDDEIAPGGRYTSLEFADITPSGFKVNGHEARVFITVKSGNATNNAGHPEAVRFFEEAKPGIGLYEDNGFVNRIRDNLRTPDVDSIAPDDMTTGFGNLTFRDAYIFV
ncbi:MAG: hypothetical protein AAGN35_00470 [Bacteroidota bacterium]